MNKCPKTLSGKHKFIDHYTHTWEGSPGLYTTGYGPYGAYPGGSAIYELTPPECKYCGVINDKEDING